MKIAIIGGGIGGLTTALALRHCGFTPEVFEQAPELLEVRAAIAVWPNAMRILQRLGLGDRIIAHAGVIKRVRWLDSEGRLINSACLPETDAPAVALHRSDLQNALLQTLPVNSIHLGRVFTAFEWLDEAIQLAFADGSSSVCDLLIGADGLHSRVRAQAFDGGPPVGCGYTVWRGITDCNPLGLMPATATELHGRGRRFGIGPVGMGRYGWWASVNQHLLAEQRPTEQNLLLKLFNGWFAPVIELIQTTPEAPLSAMKCLIGRQSADGAPGE